MQDIKENSLRKALNWAVLKTLPKQYKEGSGFWIEGIALVQKRNLTQNYVIARRDGTGATSIVADFGEMSPVIGITSIHPYLYLEDHGILDIKDEKEKKKTVRGLYPVACPTKLRDSLKTATGEDLNILIRSVLILRQLENREEDIRRNSIEERPASEGYSADGSEKMEDADTSKGKHRGTPDKKLAATDFLYTPTFDKEPETL